MSERKPTVIVLGASQDRRKYGNISVRAHVKQGYDVYPVNGQGGEVEGLTAYAKIADVPAKEIDRVTVYLPPHVGLSLIEEIAACRPKEVWLNPGADSPKLVEEAEKRGLNVIQACSIIDIGTTPLAFRE